MDNLLCLPRLKLSNLYLVYLKKILKVNIIKYFKLRLRFTRHEPYRSIPTHSKGSYSLFSLFAIRHLFPDPRLGRLSRQFLQSHFLLILLKIFYFSIFYIIKYFLKKVKYFFYLRMIFFISIISKDIASPIIYIILSRTIINILKNLRP